MVFLFIFLVVIVLLVTSKIRIEIDYEKSKISNLNDNYNMKIKLLILNKFPILWTNINKNKIQKLEKNGKLKKINFKNIKKDISLKQFKQAITKTNIKIKKFYLKAEVGTESTMLTTMIVPIISSLLAILLAKKKVKPINQKYKIIPIYNRGNLLNLEFSGIFEIKIQYIIKFLIEIVKTTRYKEKRNNGYIIKENNAY